MTVSVMDGVLAPVQARGRAALERLGLPTRRQEPWRLTDLKRLEALARMERVQAPAERSLPPASALRLVIDGLHDPLDGVTLPEGITPLEINELKQALGHTLDRCGCADDWSVEFNHAATQQVLALRISGSVPPLELVMAGGDGVSATRVLLLLDEKAELELLEVVAPWPAGFG